MFLILPRASKLFRTLKLPIRLLFYSLDSISSWFLACQMRYRRIYVLLCTTEEWRIDVDACRRGIARDQTISSRLTALMLDPELSSRL